MLIGDMTAVKSELNYNCLSQSIRKSAGLQDVVRCTNRNTASFPLNRIQVQLSLGLWQWHIYHCLFVVYLFVYLFIIECCIEGKLASRPLAPCGLRGCKNGPAPFPGRMSYKATKPGLVCLSYLSMLYYCIVVY